MYEQISKYNINPIPPRFHTFIWNHLAIEPQLFFLFSVAFQSIHCAACGDVYVYHSGDFPVFAIQSKLYRQPQS